MLYLNRVVKSHQRNVDRPYHLSNMPMLKNNQSYEATGLIAADPANCKTNGQVQTIEIMFPLTTGHVQADIWGVVV